MTETEIKFLVEDFGVYRATLHDLQAVREASFFEDNVVFDDAERSLHGAGKILRLRRSDRILITFKSPAALQGQDPRFKVMEELEIEVSDFDTAMAIINSLGYMKVFRYQKNREVYSLGLGLGPGTGPGPGSGPESGSGSESAAVLLDETPIGNYIEVEGSDRAIGEACELLNLDLSQGTKKNYLDLYRDYCERNGLKASDMVFGP